MSEKFLLKDINAFEILEDYLVKPKINEDKKTEVTTNINTILHEEKIGTDYLVYSSQFHKNKIKFWVNMIDLTKELSISSYTPHPCWWCRTTFDHHPIGCPIQYHKDPVEGTEDYKNIVGKFRELNLPTDKGLDYFATEGIFCSFPCAKAYILDKISKYPRWTQMLGLLELLYFKFFKKTVDIPPAPTWKIIKPWGHLTKEEYRKTFGELQYVETINYKRPFMFPTNRYIQEIN